LEQALVDNLEKFILELGRGFAFVERQQHIVTDTSDFYIDLVFYNFKMKRFVIFELKTHKLTHQDIGQLDMYVRMYDDLIKGPDDAPTIGVLLCTDTDNTIARYSVLHDSDQLFATKFMTYMPSEDELRNEIEQQKMEKKKPTPINIKNKKASFDYEFIDTFTAGIVLTGTEIKSIRLGKASLVDTYCYFINGELWVKNMHISEYFYGSYNNHTERRERKLLLNRKELRNWESEIKTPGLTIVPVRLFINDKGLAKLVIALARGKREFDKRQTLKEKEDRREMDRAMKF
jgi:SsrA-binding protein